MNTLKRFWIMAAALLHAGVAFANFHTFKVEQVFSNLDGTVQFIVLREAAGFNGQEFWAGHVLTSGTPTFTQTYHFNENLPSSSTSGRRVLVATEGFAALGIVLPDYIVPNGFVATPNGFVDFASVDRFNYTGLPTDGTTAMFANGSTGQNVATNFNGQFAVVSAPAPNYTSLWWNPNESGWGINVDHQGNIVFATLFTYEASGQPMWLVMSNGAMQSDGRTFTGDLFRTTGPAFNANPFTPINASNITNVGSMTFSFSGANSAALSYIFNGTAVSKTIQRQVFGARAANCTATSASRAGSTNYQDLWWNPNESGWGVNVTHQDNTLFATLFTYDATGKGLWLVMSNGVRQTDGSYLGDLYRTTGPAFNANPFTPINASNITMVGTMQFRFTDGEHGTLTYTVNGAMVTKQITRQVFATTTPACS